MKYIVRIVVSLFALVSAAACYNNEIDNPDNLQDPEQSGLRITATMAKTRVSYGNETYAQLLPMWEPYDILFGFYVDKSNNIQNFILEVVGISAKDGISSATLNFVEGKENGLVDQPVNTPVHLIYTGKNGEESITADDEFTSNGFPVDLTSQNLDRIPVCMSATASIGGTDDAKTLTFNFAYDCAVLEIESLRGFKEDNNTTATPIKKIEVSDLILDGTYKYDTEEGFRFVPNTDTSKYSIEGLAKWSVNADGKLVYDGAPKGFLIAAAPNSLEKEIDINVYDDTSSQSPYFTHHCESTTINAGRCYVVRSEEVVAKTIDGLYFTTVKAAFDHARELSKLDDYDEEDENVVTLLAPKISGLGENSDSNEDGKYDDLIIDIDYPVTLDLNGCDLLLCFDPDTEDGDPYEDNNKSGGFYVEAGGNFTITDSSEGGEGYIESNCECPIIDNIGLVTVNTGSLYNYVGKVADNGGTLTVCGGELYSSDNVAIANSSNGTVVIEDGEVDSKIGVAVSNSGSLEINGGSVYSENSYAINSVGGNITIEQLDNIETLVYTESYEYPAIYVTDDGSDTAEFTMTGGIVTGLGYFEELKGETIGFIKICGAIELEGDVDGSISGGSVKANNQNFTVTNRSGYALYVHDCAKCTISGGEIESQSDFLPSVFCYSDASAADGTSITVSNGTIKGYAGGVHLEGKVTGTFTGGEVDTFKRGQNAGCTVLVDNGSVCTISGGRYYNEGTNNPTIRAFGLENAGTKLTIGWPDGETTVGETHEPLIYVSSTNQTCVNAGVYHEDESYATVELLGGYYFINTTLITYSFFNGSFSTTVEDFDYIYTNQTRITHGNTYNLMPNAADKYYVNGKQIKGFKEGTSGFTFNSQIGGTSKQIKITYHIAPVAL